MKVYEKHIEMAADLSENIQAGATIGFVPTMGALHQGHLSLLERAKKENDICVCSVFVNPTQFNNTNDLAKYPRDREKDLALLKKAGCSIAYTPSVTDVYPNGTQAAQFDFAGLDEMMEGQHRPGHFKGMATVVKRLFEIIKPNSAYFGEKDYQQLAIINKMVETEDLPVKIYGCKTTRELDGLAMSSRNALLNAQQRHAAPAILEALNFVKELSHIKPVAKVKAKAIELINSHPVLAVEYLEVADASTLNALSEWDQAEHARVFAAVYAGNVRLIDNISLY